MARIIYNIVSKGGISGGHKMAVRHVETLRDLGFDALCYLASGCEPPAWFERKAPMVRAPKVYPGDILVLADDGPRALTQMSVNTTARTVVLAQNPYFLAERGMPALDLFPAERFPAFIAVSDAFSATLRRLYPGADVSTVPCFADERLFQPAAKNFAVAYAPRKRALEAGVIRNLFAKLHPRLDFLNWTPLEGVTEADMARAFARSDLHLSLSRLESVGMTTLEAMAAGCVCAGFPGVGGRIYMTPENGFWVPDDDCEAAADALAEAAEVVMTGGSPLVAYHEAAQETARAWSYARFRVALEETWMRLAPEARLKDGPLD